MFYFRYGWFQMRERFADVGSSLAPLFLYGFFIWLLTQMWQKFNAYQGHYTRDEVAIYIAITELLFMNFLRSPFMQRSDADFSITLSRPRSWLTLTFCGQMGASLGSRIVYIGAALCILPLLGVDFGLSFAACGRLFLLMPLLTIIEALLATFFAIAQLLWHETKYLVTPITKLFLSLGGVFAPLADYGEPGRSFFLQLPPSDVFFQVAHFCVKGQFYEMGVAVWHMRVAVLIITFFVINHFFFRIAKERHQSFGG